MWDKRPVEHVAEDVMMFLSTRGIEHQEITLQTNTFCLLSTQLRDEQVIMHVILW